MLPGENDTKLDEGRIEVVALLRTMWHYRLLISISTALCGAVMLVLALTAQEVYRAEASITEVTNNNMGAAAGLANQFGGLASLIGVNLGGAAGASREAQALLNSRYLVEEFIKRNNLIPQLYPKAQKPPTLWIAVRSFRGGTLSIREDKRAGVTIVAVNNPNPKVAAAWANGIVQLANELLRTRAMRESQRSIEYLNEQIAKTNVLEIQRVMYNLVENETKTLMLANVKSEYAFTIVDPAVPPEVRFSPQRTLMVLLGLFLGGMIGTGIAFAHNALRGNRAGTLPETELPPTGAAR